MPESAVKRLLVHTSHYSLSSFLTMVAGLVSFPLLTRIFSVGDYGIMNLIGSTLTVAVALGKVGVQHSIVRYQSEISAGKGRYTLRELASTTMFGMIGTALTAMAILMVLVHFVPARWFADSRLRLLFSVATLLIFVQVVESNFLNFLRAEQATTTLLKYQVAKRYLGLGLILTTVFFISQSLGGFYTASVVNESLALIALALLVYVKRGWPLPRLSEFRRPLYRELLGFGIPMMIGYEMAGLILAVGDRYVIEGLIGETPLGLYSAAYNLCQYVQSVFIASVAQAIMPLYMQMWDAKGVEETQAFIARSMRTYVLLAAPLIAGLAAVGPELLPSLASDKYATGAGILPWVISGMVIEGANAMVGAGLFIHRKTRVIMSIVLSCAIANIGLNFILVPRIGIMGSAIATLVSYAASALLLGAAGRRLLVVKLPWMTILRAGVSAFVMFLAVRNILPARRLLTVCVRSIAGAPVYAALVYLIDPDAREAARKPIERLRRLVRGERAA
ncbi:MAG TPA: oligosaccharide flippase family protein [Polyangia bacterium]|nr:oligosaccharide flippase family protein [Polyangia bacterium]